MAKKAMDDFSTAVNGKPMIKPVKKLLAAAVLSPEMHPSRVGERVTALRMALGLSKAELADAIEYDRSTLSKVEKGDKGLDLIVGSKIAERYGFGLDFIYRGQLTDAPEEFRSRVISTLHALRLGKILGDETTDVAP